MRSIATSPSDTFADSRCNKRDGNLDLTVRDGRVVAATILEEMTGFAREAATTGGLGGELYIVTNPADYDQRKGDKPIPGTLRYGVTLAQSRKVPMWITFDGNATDAMTIDLMRQLELPGNLTLDASCAHVVLQAPQKTMMLYIRDNRNIVIYGLTFRRTDFDLDHPQPVGSRDVLRSDGPADRIWVAHNDFSLCGHACFDVAVTPNEKVWPIGDLSRITVAFNRFRDSDKVMIFGFEDCEAQQTGNCDAHKVSAYREGPTLMFLTLQANVFERTAQRTPRVSGRAFAHIINNLFAFQPLRRKDGQPITSSYAAVSLSGASLLVEQNWFGQLTRTPGRRPLAAWTISTPGAPRMPHDGKARLRSIGNLSAADEIIGEDQPEGVFTPLYRSTEERLDFTRLGAAVAGACVIRRSGPRGAMAWDKRLCGT